ncbi:MAG TPA: hypothetical protein VG796_25980 [Verrucomicrobiales bacterium]|nr:hypothetical protein [Verrucomicrobiales bacterium]
MKTLSRQIFGLAAVSLFVASFASAQTPAPASAAEPELREEAMVRFEVISLPPLAARKALIKYSKEPELYQWLDSELEKKESGVVLETMQALRIRSGQRSKVESLDEHAYPTEFDPPQIPQTFGGNGPINTRNGSSFPVTPATPAAYTFRNLGFTGEVELTIGEDGKTVDLNLAPEIVRLTATVPHGIKGDVLQPVFQAQKATTQVIATLGQPALVCTVSPPVNTGAPGGNKSDRVWLLFVTVTIPG